MALALRGVGRSHPGRRRSNNEDSAYVGRRLLVVADGMGGAEYGEVASAIATHAVSYLDDYRTAQGADHDLPAAVEFADTRLRMAIDRFPRLAGMGTTLTSLLTVADRIVLAHIGDSRAYLARDGEMRQVTRDDSYVQVLLDSGLLTPEKAARHPQRHVLSKVLQGAGDGLTAQVVALPAVPGDRYLLCSDGLSDYVANGLIAATLIGETDPSAAADGLIELALEAGAPDNVTCVIGDLLDGVDPSDTPGRGAPGEPRSSFLGAAYELGPRPLESLPRRFADPPTPTGGLRPT